jgi:hypothetical protein
MQKIKWGEFLGRAIKMWLQDDIDKELKSIDIIRCWIVRQFQNEYNPVHHHSGHVSGVGYLKVPESFGKVSEKKKTNDRGRLTLIHGYICNQTGSWGFLFISKLFTSYCISVL